ncbi:MAG: glycosyltransferase family 4 protein [Candidatus Omnitrophica bacterium]|nr:glycosyltransferase family 4 protein [Candidatus Omnitrophota bacterium]
MKLLLINQVFWPDVAATAQHLTDLACELINQGHEVTVLCARRGYTEPHSIFAKKEIYQGIHIVRVWPFSLGRKYKILRVLDSLILNFAFALRLARLGHFERILVLTSPPLVGGVAGFFAKLWRKPLILWMMDVNPDEAIEAGWIRRNSLEAHMLESALRWVLNQSQKIIVLDRFMRDRILLKGADPNKVKVIAPWSHDEAIQLIPHRDNPFRKKNNLDGKFVVMYSGNLSICHPLNTLLEAAFLLKEEPTISFVFIGGGQRTQDILQARKERSLSNVFYFPYQPRTEIKYSLSAADLHTVVMGEPYVGIVHPCKIYGILRLGRPFIYIGPQQSAPGELMEALKTGARVDHGEAERLAGLILKMKNLSEAEKMEIQKINQALAQQFSGHEICAGLAREITGKLN